MSVIHNLVHAWKRLIGSAAEFPLATRLFHSICLIAILAYNVPLNYFVHLPFIALISAVTLAMFVAIYYFSRFKNQTSKAMIVFCIIGTLLFAANFFINSGINSPTNLFFVLTIIMMVGIVPVKRFGIGVIINLILVLGLHYLQYTNPGFIPNTYVRPLDEYIIFHRPMLPLLLLHFLAFT